MTVVTRSDASAATSLGLSSSGPRVTTTTRVSRPGTCSTSSVPNARQKSRHVLQPADRKASSVIPREPSMPTCTAPPRGATPETSTSRPSDEETPGAATPGTIRTPPVVRVVPRPIDRPPSAGPAAATSSSPMPRSCSARRTSAWLRSRPTTSTPSRPTTTPSATIAAVTSPSPSRRCPQGASPSRDGHLLAAQQHVAASHADVDGVRADVVGTGPHRDGRGEPVRRAVAQPGEVAALAVGGHRLQAPTVAVEVDADRVRRLGVHGPAPDAHPTTADGLDAVEVPDGAAVPRHAPLPDDGVAPGALVDREHRDVADARWDADGRVEAVVAAPAVARADVRPVAVGAQAGDALAVGVDVDADRVVGVRVDRPAAETEHPVLDRHLVDPPEGVGRHGHGAAAEQRVAPLTTSVDGVDAHPALAGCDVLHLVVEPVERARARVDPGHVGSGPVGGDAVPTPPVDVDVDPGRDDRVRVDAPAPHPDAARDGR